MSLYIYTYIYIYTHTQSHLKFGDQEGMKEEIRTKKLFEEIMA